MISALKAVLVFVAGFVLWSSLTVASSSIPGLPGAEVRRVWSLARSGRTAEFTPEQMLEATRRFNVFEGWVLPAVAGALIGLFAAGSGWIRRRELLLGSLLFGALMLTGSLRTWDAALAFTVGAVGVGSLRLRRTASPAGDQAA
ncbi:MAG TPA: hypothetical protein VHB47_08940 [Thermoanaerobaculia bacterium]|nr:hypothetical protein [Thermoanaerobaculia bacterium]